MTYDISVFLTNDAGAPERIISSPSEHFEMVSTIPRPREFMRVYGFLLESAVATLLYGLSILQIANSFEHRAEVKRIRDSNGDERAHRHRSQRGQPKQSRLIGTSGTVPEGLIVDRVVRNAITRQKEPTTTP